MSDLASAVAALESVARDAGLPTDQARAEALAFAAAIAESAPRAAADWVHSAGMPDASLDAGNRAFFDAATLGRRSTQGKCNSVRKCGAGVQLEALEDPLEVGRHRALADPEPRCDLGVGEALGDGLRDLPLAGRHRGRQGRDRWLGARDLVEAERELRGADLDAIAVVEHRDVDALSVEVRAVLGPEIDEVVPAITRLADPRVLA